MSVKAVLFIELHWKLSLIDRERGSSWSSVLRPFQKPAWFSERRWRVSSSLWIRFVTRRSMSFPIVEVREIGRLMSSYWGPLPLFGTGQMSATSQPCGMDVDSQDFLKSCLINETSLGPKRWRSLGWIFSGPSAFNGLRLERTALTSLVVKPGQVLLVTSSVRSVRLGVRFTPRSSLVRLNDLTDLYMFMKALAFWCWLTQAPPLSVIMQTLFGLLSVGLFSTCHI